jgi:hypothetical protein
MMKIANIRDNELLKMGEFLFKKFKKRKRTVDKL